MKNKILITTGDVNGIGAEITLKALEKFDCRNFVLISNLKVLKYYGMKNLPCDIIEVPFTDAIPADYEGAMGVPLTFLDKYCPEQFEIIGHPHGDYGLELGLKPFPRELKAQNKGLRDGDLYYMKDGRPELPYRRILIRKKQ